MSGRGPALLLCLWASVSLAQEFTRTIAQAIEDRLVCVTMSNRDFLYRLDAAGSARTPNATEFDAINAAFKSWQALSEQCSDFVFREGSRVTNPRVGKGTDDSNVITFRERRCSEVVPDNDACWETNSCANDFQCWDETVATIGLTTTTYSTRTGVALDADIQLNASDYLFTTVNGPPCDGVEKPTCVATDVQNTMTHEIGHVVGLDHVERETSTMYASAPLGELRKRTIDTGTALGFCQTYPRGRPPVPCDELAQQRTQIIGGTKFCSVGGPGLSALLAIAWLCRRRGRP